MANSGLDHMNDVLEAAIQRGFVLIKHNLRGTRASRSRKVKSKLGRIVLTRKDIDDILKLHDQGFTTNQITEKTGRVKSTVWKVLIDAKRIVKKKAKK